MIKNVIHIPVLGVYASSKYAKHTYIDAVRQLTKHVPAFAERVYCHMTFSDSETKPIVSKLESEMPVGRKIAIGEHGWLLYVNYSGTGYVAPLKIIELVIRTTRPDVSVYAYFETKDGKHISMGYSPENVEPMRRS